MPADLDLPPRWAATTWIQLAEDYATRFLPGVRDLQVLEEQYGFPSQVVLTTYAPSDLRRADDPALGLPTGVWAPKAGVPIERSPDADVGFDAYIREFIRLSSWLKEKRAPWLEVAPHDDSMRYDEASFRVLEGDILENLISAGATTPILKEAHKSIRRMDRVPESKYENGTIKTRSTCHHLDGVIQEMQKQYLRVG